MPYATHVEPACELALRELEASGYEVRRYPSTAAVDRTRCEMATRALADGFSELMWIDSDVVFEAESVTRLRKHELPLIAGLYAKKGVQSFAVQLEPDTTELRVGETGGLFGARYVGAGFLLVHRRVFDAVQQLFSLPACNAQFGQPCVPYFLPMVVQDSGGKYVYLSEDFAFCERARQASYHLMLDTSIRLGHVGKYTYAWEDAGKATVRVAGATFLFGRDVKI